MVDLGVNISSLGPCEVLCSQISGIEMVPSTFSFVRDSLCVMIYNSGDGKCSLVLWQKDLIDSTSSFFDSFQDKEVGEWRVTRQHFFSSNVTCVRKRDLSAWIGLANGMVFELQINPWDIQERDSQSFPFLNCSLFINELNGDSGARTRDNGMDVECWQFSTGPVGYLIESPNELIVLAAHQEGNQWKFNMNHFLGDTSAKGSFWLFNCCSRCYRRSIAGQFNPSVFE
jgi:hypothetical protein